MLDMQVIEIRDVLPVIKAEILQGVEPKSLKIRGKDFHNAYEVFINEQKSPDVIIMSSRELLAQVPINQVNSPIRTIVVISNRLTRTERSKIHFRLGDSVKSVSGMESLIQLYVKILLQTPGTDIFAPNTGGGLLNAVGRMSGAVTNSAGTVTSDLQIAVGRTTKQVIAIQANNSAIHLTERLLLAQLLAADFITSEQALVGRIYLGNQAGQASTVGLVV
jgi:hypothetical protein